ncbi:MAG: LON peptidase substrate-binding domain-containing protein [Acidobacteria bacterium]|nr:LON peptidase substrate-binding domain-containing protein [Acidobacteriota bacterium]
MDAETRVIPLFPLPLVQFPGALTPLHVFEPRYRKLLKDALEADRNFGIVGQEEGQSDLGKPAVGSIGCLVEVAVVQELPDGRSNILCVGGRRFRVLRYLEGEPYLQAAVEFFDDETLFDDLAWEVGQVKSLFERTLVAGRKMKEERESPAQELPDLPDEAQALSFIVSAYLEIEADEKQELLEMTDTGARLRKVHSILLKLVEDYERRALVKGLARRNGHGGKAPEL